MAEAPASPMGGGSHESGGEQSPQSGGVREQDRYLPIANISRIMKKALPANGKIAKDAKDTVQECVSEFISFITSEASDKCQKEKRKTINGDDLLWAMATLGFEEYIEPLKVYLARYREVRRHQRFCKGWRWFSSKGCFRRSAWSECPVCSAGFIESACGLYESTVWSTGLSKLRQCASMNHISSFSDIDAAYASYYGGR
ncbi:hypothetical protein EUGRSUZ_G02796 [Eucalyptus grandis]|uniref:Transcription factor CBF/NF-Y/archaeal histone domain-containing protein n=3 Tax=Eucalyptus grandis TaxID=71139 RepID=A0A059BGX0_EUCGR|nr:hypothetical protein EUGRSUZ_G02796 [Eucalyptus grandis]KAK3422368.1 hypothetical protein EUGRSUZ_G02796 [Eucalyptus grandis]